MQLNLRTSTLLFVVFAFLQAGFAASKQAAFTHQFAHGISFIPTVNHYLVLDHAYHIFNPNSVSITVQITLTAEDDDFDRFVEECDGEIKTCQFNMTIPGYDDCLDTTTTFGLSLLGFMTELEGIWNDNFTLDVRTIDASEGKKFYFYGPADGFTAYDSSPISEGLAAALVNAWQEYDDYIPVTWDWSIKRWVIPFVNFYHRTATWPVGWQTKITVDRSISGTGAYTLRNFNQTVQYNHHGHPSTFTGNNGCCYPHGSFSACGTGHTFRTICDTFPGVSYGSTTVDAHRFHIDDDDLIAQNDGIAAISIAGDNPNGTTITARVISNSDGGSCGN